MRVNIQTDDGVETVASVKKDDPTKILEAHGYDPDTVQFEIELTTTEELRQRVEELESQINR